MLVKMLLVAAALVLAATTATAGESAERYQLLNPQITDHQGKLKSVFIMFDSLTGRTWYLGPTSNRQNIGWNIVWYGPVPHDRDKTELPVTPPK